MTTHDEIEKPCYVISSNGFRESVSYLDDWCYGKSEFLGETPSTEHARELIKDHIRARIGERNNLPLYFVSDHGNVSRRRCIHLRTP
jgi:hypothetical protein